MSSTLQQLTPTPIKRVGSLARGAKPSQVNFSHKRRALEYAQNRALSAEGLTQVGLDSIQTEPVEKVVEDVQDKSDKLAYLKNLESISADIEEKKEIMQAPKLPKDNSAQLQIIDACRSELQQYKQLRAQVKPWMENFVKENGHQPTFADVLNVSDTNFHSTYKSYMLLRDKLFTEIPQLRSKLDPQNQNEEPVKKMGELGSVINCNAQESGQKAAASRFLSALEYKSQQKKVKQSENLGGQNESKGDQLERIQKLLPATSPRVRKAMMAAMEYKKNKQTQQNSQQSQQKQ
eukprot:TRINITY_DN12290_c0_g1_i1.p1 TRINITY_DN12290_c0_g1~~TRINITY_DN12290_c0_g1_i1.p1  ORF type:complete len:331 (-),score=43.25 TRINITY_DN12290_c0_g1_i1:1943-2815(-)